jgi:hypothetical protein
MRPGGLLFALAEHPTALLEAVNPKPSSESCRKQSPPAR